MHRRHRIRFTVKAYKKVWRQGLLSKMEDMEVPYRFRNFARSFLSSRRAEVEVNGRRSRKVYLNEGLPQGSSLSPMLFVVFINDIGVDLDPKTTESLFADDTSIWQCGPKDATRKKPDEVRQDIGEEMQKEVDKILEWANKWKMTINADKTKALIISTSSGDRSWNPKIKLEEEKLKTSSEYKFLGFTIDNQLRFNKHVDNVVGKAKKRVNLLKCMAAKDWGNSMDLQRILYVQYVRSTLEYASFNWSPWISETALKKL